MPCSDAYVRATGAKVQLMTWGANRCLQLGCNTTYGKGEAFLTGPGHSPFDGEAHYFCREHLDSDAVITEGVSDE